MKKLWNIIAVIAVANLLALVALVGWLKATDRLSMDRLRDLRTRLSTTVSADAAKAQEAQNAAKAAEQQAQTEQQANKPPLNAQQQLATRVELSQLDQQRLQRLREEIEGLRRTLNLERADLDRRQQQLDADKQAFAAQVAQFTQTAGDEQFKKTLGILQSLKAKEAKAMLSEMISSTSVPAEPASAAQPIATAAQSAASPARADRFGTAARYLNAMDERARTRIMSEFAKEDPQLAVQLLEALQRQGEFASTQGP